jgi:glucan phosphorylase
MSAKSIRSQLEKTILESSRKIHIEEMLECFEEAVVNEYMMAWHNLAEYYRDFSHDDTEISVETIHDYLDKLNYFFSLWQNPNTEETCKERSQDIVQEMEAHMNYIIEAVENRIYPNGRE